MLDSNVIKDTRDHRIGDLFNGFGLVIKVRAGRHDDTTRLSHRLHVPYMDEVEGCFSGDQDKFSSLFEHYVRAAQHGILARTLCNPGQRSHATRDNNHRIRWVGATGEWKIHRFALMTLDLVWYDKTAREFCLDDLRGVRAHDEMGLDLVAAQVLEQALCVNGTAGTCHSNQHAEFWI